ncbi:hypothetical protein Psi02_49360 [Planotetraspora silvatica]|uniref:Uncharacterized protein n=1 Tax=Planotetraspora silvatica TaxID=234614 RepID=A0A8J3UNU1_9ACTN|nr:hypothetical protein Psi02_49360 [Planotetraspora silvatica]
MIPAADAPRVADKNTIKGTGFEPNDSLLETDGGSVQTPTPPFAPPIGENAPIRTDWVRPDLEISPR